MTRRTSVALLALLLAPVWWLGVLAAGESAAGEGVRPGWSGARAASRQRRALARSACAGAGARPTRANRALVEAAIVCLVNRERRRRRLAAVRPNGDLDAIAARQAADMVAGGYFGDDSRSGQTAFERAASSSYGRHRSGLSLGQNIAWGAGGLSTPAAIVAAWMRSAAHRDIILTARYRDAGAGAVPAPPRHRAGRGATYALELAARG